MFSLSQLWLGVIAMSAVISYTRLLVGASLRGFMKAHVACVLDVGLVS